jgi:ribonuclease HII
MPVRSKAKKPRSPDRDLSGSDRLVHERAALKSGVFRFAGVDEAGRGPLAGPVVAAAVIFPRSFIETGMPHPLKRLNDSKVLTAKVRQALLHALQDHPEIEYAVGIVEASDIDRLNILNATHLAMAKALQGLHPLPELALVDGRPVPGLPCPSESLVKGDRLSLSISAASIVAKETRDRLMQNLHEQYPVYGFDRHKGYGTQKHLEALKSAGPCPEHRRSFRPVREALSV